MKRLNTNQKGFTILELMIATMVFSVILLGATTALIQIGKLYYKGIISSRTQETARGIVDQLGQQLQFSAGVPTKFDPQPYTTPAPNGIQGTATLKYGAICVGGKRYSYVLNVQVHSGGTARDNQYSFDSTQNQLNHVLWRDDLPATSPCEPVNLSLATPSSNGGEELLGENMRLSAFDVNCDTSNVCVLNVGVIYGDNDLLTPTPGGADPSSSIPDRCLGTAGSQWCATTHLTTSVLQRIGS